MNRTACRRPLIAVLFAFHALYAGTEPILTHSADFARVAPARWAAEGWRVDNPDPGAVAIAADGAVAFAVTTPNTAMAWTLTCEPVWMAPFRTLALSYFVEGVPEDAGGAFIELFDGSTGPITPGATNTENPLASGGRHACGNYTPGLHVELVDLGNVENLERVAEITITVRAGADPVAVRLNQLAFLADPVSPGALPAPEILRLEGGERPHVALALPAENRVPLQDLAKALGLDTGVLAPGPAAIAGFPFTLAAEAAVTPTTRGGALAMAPSGSGDTLALLLATRLWGNAEGWYSAGDRAPRDRAPGAHQARIALRYVDGAIEGAIPRHAATGAVGLVAGIAAYTVPIDPERELAEISLVEEMSYGQVALIAASMLTRGEDPVADTSAAAPEVKLPAAAESDPPGSIRVEAGGTRLVVDGAGQVIQLAGADGHAWGGAPFSLLEVAPDADAAPLALEVLETSVSTEGDRAMFRWRAPNGTPAGAREASLTITAQPGGALRLDAELYNPGDAPWTPHVALPALPGLRASRGGRPAYMLPARSALNDTAPVSLSEVYGGRFPLQFMDVYDATHGGGLACIVLDDTRRRKWFEFTQDADGVSQMAVRYRNLEIAPGERLALPPVLIRPHEGDWRAPFAEYRDWVRATFPRTRENGMRGVFYCRRDYPLGGTTYLYDVAKPAYSYDKLISESNWAFGGIDMIDISGWAYNEAIGRVGTYLRNDLGGLEALAAGVRAGHARGVQTGLYFEGYLLDKRAATAAEGLANWQLVRAGGEPAWWPGEMEFFCCPGAPGWREKLASDIAAVAAATGADAVYVDQLGILDPGKECWADNHGHPVPSNPIDEEIGLLMRVREVLDSVKPDCAIYIEHLPCDAMTPYIDGAFNLGMKHTRHALGPTKLPLHRYLTPDIPVFEMVAHGIRPIPAEADDLKLSFFHGLGLWLKGRGGSWYSEGFRALAPAFHEVLVAHTDFFRSPDAAPHIDTLREGVYANRFPHGDRVLYTLYNATPDTLTGPILAVPPGSTLETLYAAPPLALSVEDGKLIAEEFLPEEVAAVLVAP